MALWRAQPIEYLVDRLGIRRETIQWSLRPEYREHKWDGDSDPLVAVLNNVARSQWTGIESAVGVGKTFLGACLVFWFLEMFRNSRVGIIAPKAKQLELHIWREMSLLFPRFGLGQMLGSELRLDPTPHVWSAELLAAGVKAEEVTASATKAQGFHAEHLLIICEETPGIHEAVMTAFENTCVAPHNIIIAFGNPDHQADNLRQFCRRSNVQSVRISAFDYPNVVVKNPDFVPGAQSETGLANLLSKYAGNERHPLYLSRARGVSPQQAVNSLIRWEWCEAATRRDPEQAIEGEHALGVDVANSAAGDEAAIAHGKGSLLLEINEFRCPRADLLGSQQVYPMMRSNEIEDEFVGVDGVGVGSGTVNKLKEMGAEIIDLQSGGGQVEIPDRRMAEQFNNLRSQMWWQMMLDLRQPESHLILPYDKELFTDLCTPTWEPRSGKICVESKETIKARLGRSPNKGDAVVYWNFVRRGWIQPKGKRDFTFARL